jgi:hypothetical protein
MEGVKMWLSSQVANFHTGIQKLTPRYNKCLNSGDDYIEKELKYIHIFLYNTFFSSLLLLLTAHQRLLSE